MTHLIPPVNISSDDDCHLSSEESEDEITEIPVPLHLSDEDLHFLTLVTCVMSHQMKHT